MHFYLKSLGGSSFISGSFWNSNSFNLNKIFDAEPDHAINLFLDHKLQKCQHPDGSKAEVLCFKYDVSWNDTSLAVFNDNVNMLIEMERNIQPGLNFNQIERLMARAKKAATVVHEFYKLKVRYFIICFELQL